MPVSRLCCIAIAGDTAWELLILRRNIPGGIRCNYFVFKKIISPSLFPGYSFQLVSFNKNPSAVLEDCATEISMVFISSGVK